MKTRNPFLFDLIPITADGGIRDLLFFRIPGKTANSARTEVPWALHMNLEEQGPEEVLIFVKGSVPQEEVVSKVHEALNHWSRQLQRRTV